MDYLKIHEIGRKSCIEGYRENWWGLSENVEFICLHIITHMYEIHKDLENI